MYSLYFTFKNAFMGVPTEVLSTVRAIKHTQRPMRTVYENMEWNKKGGLIN